MRSLISDSERQVSLCMRKYLHGSWVNGHLPIRATVGPYVVLVSTAFCILYSSAVVLAPILF